MFEARRYFQALPGVEFKTTFGSLEDRGALQDKKELPGLAVIVFRLGCMRRHPFLFD